jgi:hypothetical protein
MSPTVVSTFTVVDMGWIAFTIAGSSFMMKLKKVRYVVLTFVCFISAAFTFELIAHGLPEITKSIEAGDYIVNMENVKNNVYMKQ